MATNYPAAKDDGTNLPSPAGANFQNNPDHAALHSNENAAIIAVETKLGTGSTTAASNTLLYGTGAGTSAWQGLTSAQLASILSDETGTGSAVFATTPTLVTPKVDTINESTPSNGTTIGGVNIKSGALNTNNSVVTTNITDLAVTTAKLNAAAVTAAKMVNGMIYRRQGGSATDWSTAGTTNFDYSATDVKVQVGSIAIGAADTAITYPVAYTNKPMVFLTTNSSATVNAFPRYKISTITITQVFVTQVSDAGAVSTTESVNWMAIGV